MYQHAFILLIFSKQAEIERQRAIDTYIKKKYRKRDGDKIKRGERERDNKKRDKGKETDTEITVKKETEKKKE